MATLSLYLFNLLPLPYLDGSQFVQAMLGILFDEGTSFDEYDIEALEAASSQRPLRRNRAKWKERLGKVIPVATCCLFVVSAVLALINVR
jgi:S2P endopeptidase